MSHQDKVVLQGLVFYGHHGLFKEEKTIGQRFIVDLELFLDVSKAGKSDEMTQSVHYGEVYDTVKEIIEGEPFNLIEAVAETVAQKVLGGFDLLDAVHVRVRKPEAPIPGPMDFAAVDIYRER